ncbi:MAG: sulfite exporter TauE/SafE family protein [Deltaproteobacteria bacterium]|nr:sulfite exporter TauE/SafE family protein [Candidatus Zymogenaceae bacterium]
MFQLGIEMGLLIVVIAFFAEYLDSSLGMGYGTSLTPILLLLGFEPLQVVPAVLLSELITGFLAGFTHHALGNVDFRPKTMNVVEIARAFKSNGIVTSLRTNFPRSLKVVFLLSVLSIIGAVFAVFVALSLPTFYLKLFIGTIIFVVGIVLLCTINREFGFSWKKITLLGLVASFNKGISGGGYGPVVVGGQLISGVDGKSAIAITSIAEGCTCLVGVTAYLVTKSIIDWSLAPYLVIGAVISVPISGITVKSLNMKTMKTAISVFTIFLGAFTILKIII